MWRTVEWNAIDSSVGCQGLPIIRQLSSSVPSIRITTLRPDLTSPTSSVDAKPGLEPIRHPANSGPRRGHMDSQDRSGSRKFAATDAMFAQTEVSRNGRAARGPTS